MRARARPQGRLASISGGAEAPALAAIDEVPNFLDIDSRRIAFARDGDRASRLTAAKPCENASERVEFARSRRYSDRSRGESR